MYNNFENESGLQNQIDAELSKFNWGAFFLNWFWAIFNGAWGSIWPTFAIMVVLAFLSYIPIIGILFVIVNFCLAIYVGKKGNEWAWYGSKKWESIESFTKTQRIWGGISPFAVMILSFVVSLFVTIIAALVFQPFATNAVKQAKTINGTAISTIVKAPEYKTMSSGEDIAEYFINNKIYYRYFTSEFNSVIADKQGPYYVVLTFVKEDGECSLERKNCYVLYNIKTSKKLSPVEKTYFDDNGLTKSESL